MARRKRSKARRSAPTAIVVRQAAPVTRRRSSAPRVIVGRVKRRRRSGGGGVGASRVVSDVVTVVAGAAMGWARANEKIPDRIVGVDTPLVVGTAMSLVPFVLRGKVGRYIGDAGAGIGAIAAYRLALGTKVYVNPKDASAGWEDEED